MARFAGTQLSNFLGGTMDYSGISGASMEGRSLERKSTMIGESEVANAGVKSLGAIQSAGYRADAIRAQGEAQGQASMASGLASGISSLAGGFGSLGSGGTSFSSPTWKTAQTEANSFFSGAMS